MKRMVAFLLFGLLLALPLGLGLRADTASAHISTYCGHGHSGIFPRHTHYMWDYPSGDPNWATHRYNHYLIHEGIHRLDHYENRGCPH
jgi:hypothetical protein